MLPIINVTLGNPYTFVIHIFLFTLWTTKCCCRKRRKRPPPKKGFAVKNPAKNVTKEKFAKPTALSFTSSSTPSFPVELLATPLAKTQTEEELFTPKDVSFERIPMPIRMKYDKRRRSKSAERIESRKLLPYPEVKPPTLSEKRRHERELEKDKKEKIASGFYQSRSDEDDTLEKVSSLKEEYTERSRRPRKRGLAKEKAERKDEREAPLEALLPPLPPPPPAPT
ncbi:unnamed protein product [Cylicocyclus nassatus]|uniref:Uncharacterized protein n=1 Tax=Cylicocyclus nassatus TaxID=53992 RepID=A0AA36GRB8_CYLNA|nr:unnamed protein product [Cylicocyclus nassatus]